MNGFYNIEDDFVTINHGWVILLVQKVLYL